MASYQILRFTRHPLYTQRVWQTHHCDGLMETQHTLCVDLSLTRREHIKLIVWSSVVGEGEWRGDGSYTHADSKVYFKHYAWLQLGNVPL